MKITFHGHSCFEIEHKNTRFIIDPFLQGNPVAKVTPQEIQVDYVLLTHGHGDHLGDAIQIAKQNNATVITNFEIATWLGFQGVTTYPMHIGGKSKFDFGLVKLTLALHGSTWINEEKQEMIPMGNPVGFILTFDDKTIYHAGDTGLFMDMQLIGMQNPIDIAFLPIGDRFTMGPDDALLAAQWLKAKKVVPMHYNTWPIIEQDASAFVRKLKDVSVDGITMEVEDTLVL